MILLFFCEFIAGSPLNEQKNNKSANALPGDAVKKLQSRDNVNRKENDCTAKIEMSPLGQNGNVPFLRVRTK